MNKQERIIVGVLFALLVGWGLYSRSHFAPPPPAARTGIATNGVALPPPSALNPDADAALSAAGPTNAAAAVAAPDLPPETTVILSNALTQVTITSRGGAVLDAQLPAFRTSVDKTSGPVRLDFQTRPALALVGLDGLGAAGAFELVQVDATTVVARATSATGIRFERTLQLSASYHIDVRDVFSNPGAAPSKLTPYAMTVGPMHMNPGETATPGLVYLGVDTLASESGSSVKHWGKHFNEILGVKGGFGCARPDLTLAPVSAEKELDTPTDWVGVRNKYFVQLLAPSEPADDCRLHVKRLATAPGLEWESVSADLLFNSRMMAPGGQVERTASYYVGPKKYDLLKALGRHQSEVMQFGWWGWFRGICSALLWTLNAFHSLIPNYAVAIILVTVVVRTLFWPITHKSTESMKKMQRIQPLVAQLREKHKDNPQKLNQATMELYREHRVNPLSGCLPMLVQIPVFIALYTVLRSAIELRFAEFLWIKDLSEPERLFTSTLHFPVNILPLLMTATTVLQTKLTPSTGDPQQQKIMMIMPVMFLFMFYNMASALVLYWTVSQGLAIVQLYWSKRISERNPLPPLQATPAIKSGGPRHQKPRKK